MAVVYATDLTVNKSTDGTPATIEQVAGVVSEWAGISDPLEPSSREGRRGSTVQTELLNGEPDEPRAWRLSLSHRDSNDTSTTWTVSVVIIEELSTSVFVRLDRTREGNQLRPTRDNPAPPACIRAILESADLNVIDGGRPLGSDVWVPDDREANEVMALVTSADRRLPVFAYTLRDEDVIDGSVFLRALTGLAHVVLIRSSLSWLLDDLLPNRMNVYGGAARLYWPGVVETSKRWDHPLWAADVPAQQIAKQVVESVVDAAVTHAGGDARIFQLERRKRDLEHQNREIELRRLQAEFDQARAVVAASDGGEEVTALGETITQLLDAERQGRISAEEDRDIMQSLGTAAENELKELKSRARAVEFERDHWKAEFNRLNESSPLAADNDESASAFRSEVDVEIESRGVVDGARPRRFIIGPRFMTNLESIGPSSRKKIVKACADVATNAPGLLSRRDDHSLRSGPGSGDPEIQRQRDGARARRCAIEQGVASARRVHYWDCLEGVIEFASVNVHDDFAIPT
jgi:hypothetical protein